MDTSNISIYEDVEHLSESFSRTLQLPDAPEIKKSVLSQINNRQSYQRKSTFTSKEDSLLMISILTTNPDETVQESYKCAVCEEIYQDTEDLKEHLIVHKKFKCKTCRKLFYKPSYLQLHLSNSHRPKQNLKCKFCDKVFSRKYCLEQHMFLHADKKHFKCSFAGCEKLFQHVNSMLTHERIHYQENRKKCTVCGKLVTRLNQHMATHNPELQHSCPICKRTFTSTPGLDGHFRKKHPETKLVLQCKICKAEFKVTQPMQFKNHKKEHEELEQLDQSDDAEITIYEADDADLW